MRFYSNDNSQENQWKHRNYLEKSRKIQTMTIVGAFQRVSFTLFFHKSYSIL